MDCSRIYSEMKSLCALWTKWTLQRHTALYCLSAAPRHRKTQQKWWVSPQNCHRWWYTHVEMSEKQNGQLWKIYPTSVQSDLHTEKSMTCIWYCIGLEGSHTVENVQKEKRSPSFVHCSPASGKKRRSSWKKATHKAKSFFPTTMPRRPRKASPHDVKQRIFLYPSYSSKLAPTD